MEIQFTCGHCGYEVPLVAGRTKHGHCPECLWSRHVEFDVPPLNWFTEPCGGMMEPVRVSRHKTFGRVIWFRCECGYELHDVPVKRVGPAGFDVLGNIRLSVPGKTTRPVTLRSVLAAAKGNMTFDQLISCLPDEALRFSLIS